VRLPSILARRFVAGDDADGAIRAGQKLQARGIRSTFDLLGEDVLDKEAARRCADANKELISKIPEGVERNVSIKLSNFGFDISEDFCLELAAGVLDLARQRGGFVRIDMEGSKHTQRTLDCYRKLRQTHDNVGIVLQAYLHRTLDDVKECIAQGDRVRICKGAYAEPPQVAIRKMDDIRKNYLACTRLLLEKGNYPAIATHDEGLIQSVLGQVQELKVPASRYEFQMLYGLRPGRWDELVKAGHNMRIYVPYGTHWFPYFYRRLRERKENIFFVLKGILGG
jgi:proline dehydrogenase